MPTTNKFYRVVLVIVACYSLVLSGLLIWIWADKTQQDRINDSYFQCFFNWTQDFVEDYNGTRIISRIMNTRLHAITQSLQDGTYSEELLEKYNAAFDKYKVRRLPSTPVAECGSEPGDSK